MNAYQAWKAKHHQRARSDPDPEMGPRICAVLDDFLRAGRTHVKPAEIYDALALTDRSQSMRQRVTYSLYRAGWDRKPHKSGAHTSWAWAPSDMPVVDENLVFDAESMITTMSNTHLTKMLAEANATLTEAMDLADYAERIALGAVLQILTAPRRKLQSQMPIIHAAKFIVTDGRSALYRLSQKLKEHRARGPARTTQPALPEPQAPTVDADAVDFVVEPED